MADPKKEVVEKENAEEEQMASGTEKDHQAFVVSHVEEEGGCWFRMSDSQQEKDAKGAVD